MPKVPDFTDNINHHFPVKHGEKITLIRYTSPGIVQRYAVRAKIPTFSGHFRRHGFCFSGENT